MPSKAVPRGDKPALPGGIGIRRARPGDIPGIVRLWQELISCHRRRFRYGKPLFAYRDGAALIYRGQLEKNIRSRNRIVLVAEMGGKLVGYANASIMRLPRVYANDREVHVSGIYIKSACRRKGVGNGFLSEIAAWGGRKGIPSIGLVCNVMNKDAMRSYRKMGFIEHHIKMSRLI